MALRQHKPLSESRWVLYCHKCRWLQSIDWWMTPCRCGNAAARLSRGLGSKVVVIANQKELVRVMELTELLEKHWALIQKPGELPGVVWCNANQQAIDAGWRLVEDFAKPRIREKEKRKEKVQGSVEQGHIERRDGMGRIGRTGMNLVGVLFLLMLTSAHGQVLALADTNQAHLVPASVKLVWVTNIVFVETRMFVSTNWVSIDAPRKALLPNGTLAIVQKQEAHLVTNVQHHFTYQGISRIEKVSQTFGPVMDTKELVVNAPPEAVLAVPSRQQR